MFARSFYCLVLIALAAFVFPVHADVIDPMPPVDPQLVFTSAPQTLMAGDCSAAMDILAEDQNGPYLMAIDTSVNLFGTLFGISFHPDLECTDPPISTVTILQGQSTASFYFKSPAAGALVVTASAFPLLNDAFQLHQIDPGPAVKFGFATPPQVVTATACSSPVTIEAQDTFGNATFPTGRIFLGIMSNSSMEFSSDGCQSFFLILSELTANQPTFTFQFSDDALGTPTITITGALATTQQTETIISAGPTKLALAPEPPSGPGLAIVAGECFSLRLTSLDSFDLSAPVVSDTPLVLTTSTTTAQLFEAPDCSGSSVPTMTLPAGFSSRLLGMSDRVSGTTRLTISAAGLYPVELDLLVSPAPPELIGFVEVGQTLRAGDCSALVTLEAQDRYGNAIAASVDLPLLLQSDTGVLTFFSDGLCAVPTTTVLLSSAPNLAQFHFSGDAPGSPRIEVSTPGFSTGTQRQVLTPNPDHIEILPAAVTAVVGEIVTLDVQVVDPSGTPTRGAFIVLVQVTSSKVASGTELTTDSISGKATLDVTSSVVDVVTITAGTATQVGFGPTMNNAPNVPGTVDFGIAPSIDSTPSLTGFVEVPYAYDQDQTLDFTGSGVPEFFVVAGPPDLFVVRDTGRVVWTPSEARTEAIVLEVRTAYGVASQSFQVTVTTPGAAPVILPTARNLAVLDLPYSYDPDGRAEAQGDPPITWELVLGPAGFTVDATTGLVHWVPSVASAQFVTLGASNSAGSNTYTFEIVVEDIPATPPQAVAQLTPLQGDVSLDVTGTSSGSFAAPGRSIAGYRWNFGDGSPLQYEGTAAHTFVLAGTYVVRLTVYDDYGVSGTAEQSVEVRQNGQSPPRAVILASATEGVDTLTVGFACDCFVGSAPIVSHAWDFGDGSLSPEPAVAHLFGPGGREVSLTVSDANGLTSRDQVFVSVAEGANLPPLLIGSVSPTSGPAPLDVELVAEFVDPDGSIAAVTWDFGDGATASVPRATHTFLAPGVYTATVTVTDDQDLTSTLSRDIVVTGPDGSLPPAIVSVPTTVGAVGATYRYDADGRPAARGTRPLTWSLGKTVGDETVGVPAGMTIDSNTGELGWEPTADDDDALVVLLVTNRTGAIAVQEWRVDVLGARDGEERSGCGCSSSSGDTGWMWAVLGWLGLVTLRRRR